MSPLVVCIHASPEIYYKSTPSTSGIVGFLEYLDTCGTVGFLDYLEYSSCSGTANWSLHLNVVVRRPCILNNVYQMMHIAVRRLLDDARR